MAFRILCDIDGVVADCSSGILRELRAQYGVGLDYDLSKLPGFRFEEHIPGCDGDMIEAILSRRGFWKGLNETPFARPLVLGLRRMGVVHFVTARRKTDVAVQETTLWLAQRFLDWDFQLEMGVRDKSAYCRINEIAVAIEDSAENALQIAPVCPVALMDYSYNRKIYAPGLPIFRAKDAYHALSFVSFVKNLRNAAV